MRVVAREPSSPAPAVAPRLAPVALVAALLASACADPAIGVRLLFPSVETFLLSSVASVEVYDGEGTGEKSADALCRALSIDASEPPAGLSPIASASKVDVCALREGGVTLDVAVGRRVVFAQTERGTTALLRGCTVADLTGTADSPTGDDAGRAETLGVGSFVDVPLASLPSYPDDVALTCDDVDAKCEERQACTE